jgi:hypothetical protein
MTRADEHDARHATHGEDDMEHRTDDRADARHDGRMQDRMADGMQDRVDDRHADRGDPVDDRAGTDRDGGTWGDGTRSEDPGATRDGWGTPPAEHDGTRDTTAGGSRAEAMRSDAREHHGADGPQRDGHGGDGYGGDGYGGAGYGQGEPDGVPAGHDRGAAAGAGGGLTRRDVGDDDPNRLVPARRAADYQQRWESLKAHFVDEPRTAVRGANELVGEVLDDIEAMFRQQRGELERDLHDDAASTEDLRLALGRYRTFFDRLLSF